MKLGSRDAVSYFSRPDPARTGLLIYGPDSMRVALRRAEVIKALVGETGEEEMRLTRLSGTALRKDTALLADGLKAQGFFPGQRVVFLEDATDSLTPIVDTALSDWQAGDAILIVTAGQLNARSSLRKYFESHPNAYAVGVYADPPSRQEIETTLAKAGITEVNSTSMQDLLSLARDLDPGDFRQTMEKLALYKIGDETPVSGEDIAACAPVTIEAAVDDALNLVAESRTGEIGPMMLRLEGQGLTPTSICVSATRHFRSLHMAACHPKGPEAGLSAMRPPVFGPRRDRMLRQSRELGVRRLEHALIILTDTDLALRSSRPIPARALLERAFIRIAMMPRN